jgi:hypothetical protein
MSPLRLSIFPRACSAANPWSSTAFVHLSTEAFAPPFMRMVASVICWLPKIWPSAWSRVAWSRPPRPSFKLLRGTVDTDELALERRTG